MHACVPHYSAQADLSAYSGFSGAVLALAKMQSCCDISIILYSIVSEWSVWLKLRLYG